MSGHSTTKLRLAPHFKQVIIIVTPWVDTRPQSYFWLCTLNKERNVLYNDSTLNK